MNRERDGGTEPGTHGGTGKQTERTRERGCGRRCVCVGCVVYVCLCVCTFVLLGVYEVKTRCNKNV